MSLLSVKGVNQYYGGSHILRDVSLQAQLGKVTVLLGRNGVGKTTLLKSLMGLVPIKTGTIEFDGKPLQAATPYERARAGIGFVPQGREIFARLTVEENLRMGLAYKPGSTPIPAELYELFPVLKQMLNRRGGDLSGGQQQQLAIARALAAKPKLLILDEPTEGIQPSIIKDIERVIAGLAKQRTMAILLVEQYYDFARTLADRYVVLQRGEVLQSGSGTDMDADGVLGPRALERMVAALVRPGWLTRQRPMIVASNVLVRRAHYWVGWRGFFTMRHQLALQVAREYMTSISITRNNTGLLPVTGVSGALYATWTTLHQHQPRYAAYVQALRWRDVVAWWLGVRPPRFAEFRGAPNIEATAGPGDDTWMAWLAIAARWRHGQIDLELPRSPLHALGRLVRSWFVRPIAYDPLARVYTATPTAIRALWKQRVRWNSSRPWLLHRFGRMPYFAWDLGAWVMADLLLLLFIHATILIGVLWWPMADRPAAWLALLVLGYLFNFAVRGAATLLAMIQDHDVRGHWHKLLALPLETMDSAALQAALAEIGRS